MLIPVKHIHDIWSREVVFEYFSNMSSGITMLEMDEEEIEFKQKALLDLTEADRKSRISL